MTKFRLKDRVRLDIDLSGVSIGLSDNKMLWEGDTGYVCSIDVEDDQVVDVVFDKPGIGCIELWDAWLSHEPLVITDYEPSIPQFNIQ